MPLRSSWLSSLNAASAASHRARLASICARESSSRLIAKSALQLRTLSKAVPSSRLPAASPWACRCCSRRSAEPAILDATKARPTANSMTVRPESARICSHSPTRRIHTPQSSGRSPPGLAPPACRLDGTPCRSRWERGDPMTGGEGRRHYDGGSARSLTASSAWPLSSFQSRSSSRSAALAISVASRS